MIERIYSPARVALGALMLLLMLTACGSDAPTNEAAEAVSPSATTESETVAAAPADETGDDASDENGTNGDGDDAVDQDPGDDTGGESTGIDIALFFEGALTDDTATAECTLSEGSETSCYQLTVVGYPVDGEIGPFCPRTTSDTADEAGIWLDGENLYDLDGQFILDLAEIYGDDVWQLYDEDGNVRVTDTAEAFDAAARPDVDPEYQNYCVEGRIEWLDGGEPVASSVEIPVVPVAADSPTPVSGSIGVTLNGVTIDGAAPVDAILGAYTIAAFDDCGGHVNPVAGYHMHGATGCSEGESFDGDSAIFAYALDGYAIHSPLEDAQLADAALDICNGHTTEASGYHYHAAPAEENAVLSCFMGQTAGASTDGRGDRPAGPDNAPAADEGAAAADDQDGDHDDADHSHDATGAEVGYLDSYTLVDEAFGTMVSVTVEGDTRTILSNSIPDHEIGEFPNSGNPNTMTEQSLVFEYTTDPTYVGNAGFAQQPGVAINGVAFEPGTAETVTCESGETYRIEGLQDLYNLGMDFNNAHVQPTGQYHYHGIADLLVDSHETGDDLVLVGFAADGFLMYYSNSGAYESSYQLSTTERAGSECLASGPAGGTTIEIEGSAPDGTYNTDWVYVEGAGDLDSCNGIEINGVYGYVLTDEYPFVPRCLNGEFTARGPGAGAAPGGDASTQGGAPDFSEAAAALGVTEDELLAALGGPPPDLDAAAEILGVTVEELEAVMPAPPA